MKFHGLKETMKENLGAPEYSIEALIGIKMTEARMMGYCG